MKEIYSNNDFARVEICREVLEQAGIPAIIRNENDVLTGIGSPAFAAALCVVNDEDEARANEVLAAHLSAEQPVLEDWLCAKCGESVPGTFGACWKCETPRPAPAPPPE